MINNDSNHICNFSLDYKFSSREIALLAKFLRNNQDSIPEGLQQFYKSVEEAIYNKLTLEEATRFFS